MKANCKNCFCNISCSAKRNKYYSATIKKPLNKDMKCMIKEG